MTQQSSFLPALSRRWLQVGIPAALVLLVVGYTLVSISFEQVRFPGTLFAAQLAFDPALIKQQYATLVRQGTLSTYATTQVIDFLFIVGNTVFGFLLHVALSRAYSVKTLGYRVALFGCFLFLVSGIMDALENLTSFVMLANPSGFADQLAPVYSTFAAIKWGIAAFGIPLLLIELVAVAIVWRRRRL